MKKIVLIISLLAVGSAVVADEGMWLPSLIESRIIDMQNKGLKLSATDIYSVNEACLKDAVVQFGGGCTANLVSEKGLIFTNHHCGFSQIQSHSSVEHDYLKNGFWAQNLSEELPNRGLTVRMLQCMEDVTTRVLEGVTEDMDEAARKEVIDKNRAEIVKENLSERWIRATV
ncbi:MAG: S46 family peptidase, partial [Prevotellaceae bacterium]|nr:S46 family peptidase [Prevotellaceae bacterium]